MDSAGRYIMSRHTAILHLFMLCYNAHHMKPTSPRFSTVDDYIAQSPANIREILEKIRTTIRTAAPDATESISYAMPAYKLDGKPLVYFAAFPRHIGFYATPKTHTTFATELAQYKQGKGSVQFPLEQTIPYELIATMTAHKVAEIRSQ
jgi:uncharacterized protein YdhG (YjbR/CyaY superfamily)